MNQFRYKWNQFMQGRYGMDPLYYALLILYLFLLLLNLFFRRQMIFGILAWAVLIVAFYRFFSRNTYQRSLENQKFLSLMGKIGNLDLGQGGFAPKAKGGPSLLTKLREFPQKKYATCPQCKASLRLPRQRGKHTVRCPRCGNRFPLRIIIGKK